MRQAALVWALMAVLAGGVRAQDADAVRAAYFAAVAEYFGVPDSEVDILGDWRLPADEIPVVLFIAQRAGISPEALVALRRSGTPWLSLARRYQVGAAAFHVPLSERAPAGRLEGAYAQYRELPASRWGEVALADAEVVALVNVRVLSESVGLSIGAILEEAGASGSFLDLFARLAG